MGSQLEAVFQGHDARTAELAREIERLKDQASHLVRFLATGGDSPAVRDELRVIETALAGLRAEWATIEKASALPPPRVHPAWVMTKLERLDALLRQDPQRAKVEILTRADRATGGREQGEEDGEGGLRRKGRRHPAQAGIGDGEDWPTAGSGSWGGRRPSPGGYVAGTGARTGAPPPEGVDVGYPLGLPGDRLLAAEMRLLILAFFMTPRDFSFPVYAQG